MTDLYQWISTGFHQHSPEAPDVFNLEVGSSKLSSSKYTGVPRVSRMLHWIPLQNLHYTRRIMPKRVTSCGAHLRGLAPGQHSSEETSQRWHCVDLTGPGIKPRTSRTDSVRLATELTAGLDSALLLYSRKFRQKNNKTCLKCSEW